MNIGDKIRQARIAKGLTQEELGNLLGVQKSAIAKYENGRVVNLKRTTIQKLAEALNLYPSDLIDEGQYEKSPINDEADEAISMLNKLTPENRSQAEKYLAFLLSTQDNP